VFQAQSHNQFDLVWYISLMVPPRRMPDGFSCNEGVLSFPISGLDGQRKIIVILIVS